MRLLGWVAGAAALALIVAWLRLREDERRLADEAEEHLRGKAARP